MSTSWPPALTSTAIKPGLVPLGTTNFKEVALACTTGTWTLECCQSDGPGGPLASSEIRSNRTFDVDSNESPITIAISPALTGSLDQITEGDELAEWAMANHIHNRNAVAARNRRSSECFSRKRWRELLL